jgi:TRAP-type mannitol/chloroaromatic compound transport system substrate-binding protein
MRQSDGLRRMQTSSLTAFRNESLAWNQVAELSYDSFMMRMRTRT